jgi:dihydroorotase
MNRQCMLKIKNVKTLEGTVIDFALASQQDQVLDAKGTLTMLPALIDPHVHFRVPGTTHKEDWNHAAKAAIAGGVTTVFDMPNNFPSCTTKNCLEEKIHLIEKQLEEVKIPLRYHLYLGADQNSIEEIGKCNKQIIGVKIYMGSSTGDLLMTDNQALDDVFRIAAQENLIVSVHAEDEEIIHSNKCKYDTKDPSVHSKIRDRTAAIKAVNQALSLAEKYNNRLAILHVSTKEELGLIKEAKKKELLVFCEVTPHHLFMSENDYLSLGTKAQVNPPLRTIEDQKALWKGIEDGTVDMIGSDHAPHTLEEKSKPYGIAPSGIPGIETMLPLLLNAYNEKKITLEKIIQLTSLNIKNIFELKPNDDLVLVDLNMSKKVIDSQLKTKCGWSPFAGRHLKGWPVYTILKGRIFHVA